MLLPTKQQALACRRQPAVAFRACTRATCSSAGCATSTATDEVDQLRPLSLWPLLAVAFFLLFFYFFTFLLFTTSCGLYQLRSLYIIHAWLIKILMVYFWFVTGQAGCLATSAVNTAISVNTASVFCTAFAGAAAHPDSLSTQQTLLFAKTCCLC
jgi:hypothetical protein